ncbi:MAG: hypothetical protein ACC655_09655 [Rhodothermia bacterium]
MTLEYVFILLSIVAVGATFVVLIAFGLRNISRGKHSKFTIGSVVIPFVIFGIVVPLVDSDFAKAAILTVLIMVVIAIIGLLYSGARGLTG